MRMTVGSIVTVSVLLAAPLLSQTAGPVSVLIVDATTGRPVQHAMVRVRSKVRSPVGFLTGPDGRARLDGLPNAVVTVSRAGYADAERQLRPTGLPGGGVLSSTVLTVRLFPEGVITGVVTDIHGAPMPRAVVRAMHRGEPSGGAAPIATALTSTDDHGSYWLGGVAPGEYVLSVREPIVPAPGTTSAPKTYWFDLGERGQGPAARQVDGFDGAAPFALSSGQTLRGADIGLPIEAGPTTTGAAISGVVTDDAGIPVAGASIQVLPAPPKDGATVSWVGSPLTDNRGAFRIWGLRPGGYYVLARLQPPVVVLMRDDRGHDQPVAPAPVFCPGRTTLAEARKIVIGAEREIAGVDVRMPFLDATHIDITVAAAHDVLTFAQVALIQDPDGAAIPAGLAQGNLGPFTLVGVRPGRYRVVAAGRARNPPVVSPGQGPLLWGTADLEVDSLAARSAVTVNVEWGVTVSGRVEAAEADLPRGLWTVALVPRGSPGALGHYVLAPAWGFQGGGPFELVQAYDADRDGRFLIPSAPTGSYVVQWRGPKGWHASRATLNGRDILQTPFEVRPHQDITGIVITVTNR